MQPHNLDTTSVLHNQMAHAQPMQTNNPHIPSVFQNQLAYVTKLIVMVITAVLVLTGCSPQKVVSDISELKTTVTKSVGLYKGTTDFQPGAGTKKFDYETIDDKQGQFAEHYEDVTSGEYYTQLFGPGNITPYKMEQSVTAPLYGLAFPRVSTIQYEESYKIREEHEDGSFQVYAYDQVSKIDRQYVSTNDSISEIYGVTPERSAPLTLSPAYRIANMDTITSLTEDTVNGLRVLRFRGFEYPNFYDKVFVEYLLAREYGTIIESKMVHEYHGVLSETKLISFTPLTENDVAGKFAIYPHDTRPATDQQQDAVPRADQLNENAILRASTGEALAQALQATNTRDYSVKHIETFEPGERSFFDTYTITRTGDDVRVDYSSNSGEERKSFIFTKDLQQIHQEYNEEIGISTGPEPPLEFARFASHLYKIRRLTTVSSVEKSEYKGLTTYIIKGTWETAPLGAEEVTYEFAPELQLIVKGTNQNANGTLTYRYSIEDLTMQSSGGQTSNALGDAGSGEGAAEGEDGGGSGGSAGSGEGAAEGEDGAGSAGSGMAQADGTGEGKGGSTVDPVQEKIMEAASGIDLDYLFEPELPEIYTLKTKIIDHFDYEMTGMDNPEVVNRVTHRERRRRYHDMYASWTYSDYKEQYIYTGYDQTGYSGREDTEGKEEWYESDQEFESALFTWFKDGDLAHKDITSVERAEIQGHPVYKMTYEDITEVGKFDVTIWFSTKYQATLKETVVDEHGRLAREVELVSVIDDAEEIPHPNI